MDHLCVNPLAQAGMSVAVGCLGGAFVCACAVVALFSVGTISENEDLVRGALTRRSEAALGIWAKLIASRVGYHGVTYPRARTVRIDCQLEC